MIKNVIFDFGKVLVDYDFKRFFNMLRAENPQHEAFAVFETFLLDRDIADELDRGMRPFAEYVELYKAQYPQCADLIDAFDTRFQEIVLGEVDGMSELLARLKAAGYRILGLSNWSTKVYDTMQRYDIFSYIEGSVISCDVHYLKPEPEIYRTLLDKFGIKASESVFVDDRQDNVDGAIAVGIDAIVFTGAADLRRQLALRGVTI